MKDPSRGEPFGGDKNRLVRNARQVLIVLDRHADAFRNWKK